MTLPWYGPRQSRLYRSVSMQPETGSATRVDTKNADLQIDQTLPIGRIRETSGVIGYRAGKFLLSATRNSCLQWEESDEETASKGQA
jgi:hypothetical protein